MSTGTKIKPALHRALVHIHFTGCIPKGIHHATWMAAWDRIRMVEIKVPTTDGGSYTLHGYALRDEDTDFIGDTPFGRAALDLVSRGWKARQRTHKARSIAFTHPNARGQIWLWNTGHISDWELRDFDDEKRIGWEAVRA